MVVTRVIPRVATAAPPDEPDDDGTCLRLLQMEEELCASCRSLTHLLSGVHRQLALLTTRALVTVPVHFCFRAAPLLMTVLRDTLGACISESELGARIASVARAPVHVDELRRLSLRLATPVDRSTGRLTIDEGVFDAALSLLKRKAKGTPRQGHAYGGTLLRHPGR